MNKSNPWDQTMVRMQLPPGMAPQIAAGGFTVDADEERCVLVPKAIGEDLKAHGLVPFVAVDKGIAKK